MWWLRLDYVNSLPEGNAERDSILWSITEAGKEDTEQPEPLTILNTLRFLGTTYWEGGLADQPHLLVRELNAAMKGQQQYDEERAVKAAWETLAKE